MPRDSLTAALASRLGYYHLEGTKIAILQGDMTDRHIAQNASANDIAAATQSLLASRQQTIDSLRAELAMRELGSAYDLLPEIQVVFPPVRSLAVTRTLFARDSDGKESPDTIDMALISVRGHFPRAERDKLADYLKTRLHVPAISVVEVPASDLQ